jgi:hypothetical protein
MAKAKMAGNDLNKLVEQVISDYRAQNHITESHSRVLQMPHTSSGRTGAIDIESTNETAEILLHRLAKDAKEREPEQDRIEMEAPPMLVIAKRVKSFVMFFCGFKNEKAIWSYGTDHLAQRFNFNQAEEISAQLGEDVYALPAPERRKAARMSSW